MSPYWGFGSQGHARRLSLRDSGATYGSAAEGSKSREKAEAQGLRVLAPYEACEESDLIMVLTPDPAQRKVYAAAIEPNLVPGDALFFSHGFNIRFGYIKPPEGVDVALVAPRVRVTWSASTAKAAVSRFWLRSSRTHPARPGIWRSRAKAIGGLRAGGIKTTFTEETEIDLFGEQVVLCGGVSALVTAASRRSPRLATSLRWPTSSACTSSS